MYEGGVTSANNEARINSLENDIQQLTAQNNTLQASLKAAQQNEKKLKEEKQILQQQIGQLQTRLKELIFTNLFGQYENSKQTLKNLTNEVLQSLKETHHEDLKTLLEAQSEVSYNNSSFALRQLEKIKNKLGSQLSSEKINALCQVQVEVVELEKQIKEEGQQQIEAHMIIVPPAYQK
jgi:chromosome segregation ATPase